MKITPVGWCAIALLVVFSLVTTSLKEAEQLRESQGRDQERREYDEQKASELAALKQTVFVNVRTGEQFTGCFFGLEHGATMSDVRRYVVAKTEPDGKTIRLSWGGGDQATQLPAGWGTTPRLGADVYDVRRPGP
jgi:hypothetical protein